MKRVMYSVLLLPVLAMMTTLWTPSVSSVSAATPGICVPVSQDPGDPPPAKEEVAEDDVDESTLSPTERLIRQLNREVKRLREELEQTRAELAQAKLQSDQASRELDELKQFITDNREYGEDFAQYLHIKKITAESERRRAAEEARQNRLDELKRRREAAEQRRNRNAGSGEDALTPDQQQQLEQLAKAGFRPLGLAVFVGRTGFFYSNKRTTGSRVEWEPNIGHFLEPISYEYVDFTRMTISGTVLNASDGIRNIGIAVAFFDRAGNQVGSETILVNNARPNVPYPFTSNIEMGLDGPFASSSAWVLYSDPVE